MTPIQEFEAQDRLQPGQAGWWKVWGARVSDIRIGDIVMCKNGSDGSVMTDYVAGTFTSKAAPLRRGFFDHDGEIFTIGVMAPVVLVRFGTHNTLA